MTYFVYQDPENDTMNPEFKIEANEFVHRNPECVEYFANHGSLMEKAIAKTFLEAAGDKNE